MFSLAWGIPPLRLTPEGVWKVLATLLVGRYRTPDQYVSHARRRHTILDPATELSIREYVRACKRGSGPAKAKVSFPFESLFNVPTSWVDSSLSESTPALVSMMVLNCWWITRDIEAAARVIHVTFDHDRRSATWLVPASKRDPRAAGEARTRGCCFAAGVRHSVCPYHLLVRYFALLAAKFGPGFDTVQRNLSLLLARNSDALLKHQVITAHRSVVASSGTTPTMVDGIGKTRQRFGGHVCRAVGAVWYQNRKELHLVQWFARWGVAGYRATHPKFSVAQAC